MIYFIPAWYQENTWNESEQKWYVRRARTEFDDTVKQIQLFHRSKVYPYRIMLLSFAPNFRHFLHRQSVYRAPYWSCFDAIQEVRRKKVFVLSYHNLNWPEGVEFIYSPFAAVAQLNGVRYANIEFGENGNPIQIDMYEAGMLKRRNIYDDRGFVSSTILFKEEQPDYQDYLMENGTWKMRYFYSDGHVEINPKAAHYLLSKDSEEIEAKFCKLRYSSIEEVIHEVLTAYLELTEDKDIFCVAMHERHGQLMKDVLQDRRMVLSFYNNRYDFNRHPEALEIMEVAGYVVADSEVTLREIKKFAGKVVHRMCIITPYDSRVDYGISQQLSVQKILVPIDGMEDAQLAELIKYLAEYLPNNDNARVCLFTRQADYYRKSQVLQQVKNYLKQAGLDEELAGEQVAKAAAEINVDDEETEIKFFVEQCVNELAVSKCMREQRIVLDLRNTLDLYLQITALSIGIPQILSHSSQFVHPWKNGIILESLEKLNESLDYYLDGLTNWNESLVHCRELSKYHTTGMLIDRWKEVIRSVG